MGVSENEIRPKIAILMGIKIDQCGKPKLKPFITHEPISVGDLNFASSKCGPEVYFADLAGRENERSTQAWKGPQGMPPLFIRWLKTWVTRCFGS